MTAARILQILAQEISALPQEHPAVTALLQAVERAEERASYEEYEEYMGDDL